MAVDEFYFHRKRGLPKWERIGHPLDTLTVIACFAFLVYVPFSSGALALYFFLVLFSSLFVTKDEFVHAKYCSPLEQWLHAVLFVLHPVVLLVAGFAWLSQSSFGIEFLNTHGVSADSFAKLYSVAKIQLIILMSFLFYQILYWNIFRRDDKTLRSEPSEK